MRAPGPASMISTSSRRLISSTSPAPKKTAIWPSASSAWRSSTSSSGVSRSAWRITCSASAPGAVNSSVRARPPAVCARATGSCSAPQAWRRWVAAAGPGREHLDLTELQHNFGRDLRSRRLLERALQIGSRTFGGTLMQRCPRRLAQSLDHPVLPPSRRGHQLRGDSLRRQPGLGEDLGCARMQQLALAGRHLVVDRITHERVDETQRRLRRQDLRSGQLRTSLRHLGLAQSGERSDERQRRVGVEDRHRAGHRRRFNGQAP